MLVVDVEFIQICVMVSEIHLHIVLDKRFDGFEVPTLSGCKIFNMRIKVMEVLISDFIQVFTVFSNMYLRRKWVLYAFHCIIISGMGFLCRIIVVIMDLDMTRN